jgi:alkylhydroperoxidase family enzyme
MSEAVTRLRKAVVERVLHGDGKSTGEDRRAAFDNHRRSREDHGVPEPARALLDKVTQNAWKVTDEDVAAAKQAGLSDDQVFELAVAASLGQATRQFDAAMAALAVAKEPTK